MSTDTTVIAVLIDTVSIQKYVFAGNSLKENLGASYLVEDIYIGKLKEVLKKLFDSEPDLKQWSEEKEIILLNLDKNVQYEIGYIGGGNALLLFRSADKAKEFIQKWTKQLLITAPGLQTAVAIKKDFDLDDFKTSFDQLHQQLPENKNKYFPNTELAKYGITADCSRSGLSAAVYHQKDDIDGHVSLSVKAKLIASEKSKQKILSDFKDVLANKYTFTGEIDKLGQKEEESYIAVVHIDGNEMGQRFMQCQTLQEYRALSVNVDKATKTAFDKLLAHIIDQIETFKNVDNGFSIRKDKKDNHKDILPIRLLVLKGDDLTFVTDGRLGVHFAQKFIKYFQESFDEIKKDNQEPVSACAGVAITKTKYPFYKGYQIAEQLCNRAKEEARKAKNTKNTSWLDFCVIYGGTSGNLTAIRAKHYQTGSQELYFGPYLVSGRDINNEKNIINLQRGLKGLGDSEKWPRSKLKKLRTVLALGKAATEEVVSEMKARGAQLPEILKNTSYASKGWKNERTPYFEMIELLEFYPQWLLLCTGEQAETQNIK